MRITSLVWWMQIMLLCAHGPLSAMKPGDYGYISQEHSMLLDSCGYMSEEHLAQDRLPLPRRPAHVFGQFNPVFYGLKKSSYRWGQEMPKEEAIYKQGWLQTTLLRFCEHSVYPLLFAGSALCGHTQLYTSANGYGWLLMLMALCNNGYYSLNRPKIGTNVPQELLDNIRDYSIEVNGLVA